MNKSIKIAIADDELLFLQGLKSILENEVGFEVIVNAENGKDLIAKLKSLNTKPDIVITDLKNARVKWCRSHKNNQKRVSRY